MAQVPGDARNRAIIDVGGGDSTLVDALVALNTGAITVLDLSAAALDRAKDRVGPRGLDVTWLEADVVRAALPADAYDIWHDRAVFHFLTDGDDQRRYVAAMTHALRPGGTSIIATFALDGPASCSGLPVARYSAETLAEVLGADFELVRTFRDVHLTPAGAEQRFTYVMFRLSMSRASTWEMET